MESTELKPVQLSPSRMNLFNECALCFYKKEVMNIKRPSGPMASIPRGIDRDLKNYYDQYRGSLPPEIRDEVPGMLFGISGDDYQKLESWRKWQKKSFRYDDKQNAITVMGAIDDCLVDGEVMIPLDYKTKNGPPKTNGAEYYQLQLDCYMLFLEQLGYKVDGRGYLAYYYPAGVITPKDDPGITKPIARFNFGTQVFCLECSTERAVKTILAAAKCIRSEKAPEPAADCEYCKYVALSKTKENPAVK